MFTFSHVVRIHNVKVLVIITNEILTFIETVVIGIIVNSNYDTIQSDHRDHVSIDKNEISNYLRFFFDNMSEGTTTGELADTST